MCMLLCVCLRSYLNRPKSITFLLFFSVFVVILNSVYVKYVARVQTLFTVSKIIPLIIIIVIGLLEFFVFHNKENVSEPFENTVWSMGGISSSILTGLFTYGGW